MKTIEILDKKFRKSISSYKIQSGIRKMARQLQSDLQGKEIVYIVLLNGAFMFAADLLKRLQMPGKIAFLKPESYEGTRSSGQVKEIIGLHEEIGNKTVILIEDIIETGNTLDFILALLKKNNPAEIKIVSLLFKPDTYRYQHVIDYTGFLVPGSFVVGYGLDYNGFGRNLSSIYTIIN